MDDPEPYCRLLVEVSEEDPIAGRIWPAHGDARPFHGWIGLAAAITGLLAETEGIADGK
jgi:hypothetical protein